MNSLFGLLQRLPSKPTLLMCCVLLGAASHAASLDLNPEIIKTSLLNNDSEKSPYPSTLKLAVPKRLRHDAGADIPCKHYSKVEIRYEKLLSTGKQAVLYAASNDCEFNFVIVLDRQDLMPEWQLVATVPLQSLHQSPILRFASLVQSGEKEIVLENRETDWGTGISQNNMTILKLIRGELRVVFDQTQKQKLSLAGSGIESEESTFSFEVRKRDGLPDQPQILQHQIIRQGNKTVDRRFLHIWNPELVVFASVRN